MSPRPAGRATIPPFYVMEVLKAAGERERAGGEVLHLEVGQPSTPAPAAVVAAAIDALGREPVHYTDAAGTPELRAAITAWYAERYGVDVDPSRIVVTAGASGAFVLGFLAAFDVGARVAVASPGYPCYRNILDALGCASVPIEVDAATRFQPAPALLDAAVAAGGPLAGVVVASPSNPTGTMLGRDELAALAAWCRANDAWLVSDEIYHGITYDEPAVSALELDPDDAEGVIVVNSFSKYFSMTGWRLGWMVLPPALVTPVERLAQNLTVAPPTLPQLAAPAAFDAVEELDGHVRRYAENRRVLLDGLAAAGFTEVAPADGAFYVWVDVGDLTDDSEALCREWLDELGVAATPGIDFDQERGRRFVRFSFAGDGDAIAEAVRRLGEWRRRHYVAGPWEGNRRTSD